MNANLIRTGRKRGAANRNRKIAPQVLPLVRQLLERQNELRWTDRRFSKESGYAESIFPQMRSGHMTPSLPTFISLANTLKFEVILKEPDDATQPKPQ